MSAIITTYKAGVDTDITSKTAARSVTAAVHGARLKELADIVDQNFFMKGGSSFGAVPVFGTADNYALDVFTNNTRAIRIFANGNKAFYNTTTDAGFVGDFGTNDIRTGAIRLNNSVAVNPSNYNIIRRNNTSGVYDLIEMVSGGASGGYLGGLLVRTNGSNANTNPALSLAIHKDKMRFGDIEAIPINIFNNLAKFQLYIDETSQSGNEAFTIHNKTWGTPLVMGFFNSGEGRWSSAIVAEHRQRYYDGNISFFTTPNSVFGNKGDMKRAMIIDADQNVGIGVSGTIGIGGSITYPTSRCHVKAASGYNQFRLETSVTPTGTSDTNGNAGDWGWDDSYIYVKTSAGWKRSALTTF